jgi:hypothetical protein
MSKQTNSLSRRQFLKGAAYASALSVGGLSVSSLSSVAFAGSSKVTLLNQGNKTVALDAAQPISLEKLDGWVAVKLNMATETNNGQWITLAVGEQRSFTVDSDLVPALKKAGGHIVITSEQAVFDKMVPMATFDVVVV